MSERAKAIAGTSYPGPCILAVLEDWVGLGPCFLAINIVLCWNCLFPTGSGLSWILTLISCVHEVVTEDRDPGEVYPFALTTNDARTVSYGLSGIARIIRNLYGAFTLYRP